MTLEEAIRHCEEVAERYDKVEDSHADDGLKQECIQCAADHRQLAEWLTELKALRAADVQPIKHGRWIGNEVIQCSNCNFTMNGNAYGKLVYKYFKYCPNCGARMDGDTNDRV